MITLEEAAIGICLAIALCILLYKIDMGLYKRRVCRECEETQRRYADIIGMEVSGMDERLTEVAGKTTKYFIMRDGVTIESVIDKCAILEDIIGQVGDFAEMVKLVQAQAEGRVYIAPCKDGDEIFLVLGRPIGDDEWEWNIETRRYKFMDTENMWGVYGDAWFATREEAEAAIQEGKT